MITIRTFESAFALTGGLFYAAAGLPPLYAALPCGFIETESERAKEKRKLKR